MDLDSVSLSRQSDPRCQQRLPDASHRQRLPELPRRPTAKAHPCSRTGERNDGKVINARALLLHALRQMIGFGNSPIHADVIFTSPSVKAYGPEIAKQLKGTHSVTIPADAEVIGSKPSRHHVTVHTAIPQLEGYQAFKHIQAKVKGHATIIDIGNRTILLTQVSETGRILKRRASMKAASITWPNGSPIAIPSRRELIKTPSPQQVIDYLLDQPHDETMIAKICP